MGASSLRADRASRASHRANLRCLAHSATVPLRNYGMFAGVGGMELGLHRAGIETVAVAETDPYASRVLAARFPNVPNLGDVTKADPPAGVNFISAGFPCQDISNAGQRAGITGSRSGLYGEVVRAIRLVRPIGALLENVAALLNRGMGTVLGDLAEVGYDAEWHCIPASAVGAPHRRDRVWIFADPGSEQHEGCRPPISGEIAEELSRTAADAQVVFRPSLVGDEPNGDSASAGEVADTDRAGQAVVQGSGAEPERFGNGAVVGGRFESGRRDQWSAEPNVGRVANGVPSRVDRLRCLGNAVVPQIPELIGRAILASLAQQEIAA